MVEARAKLPEQSRMRIPTSLASITLIFAGIFAHSPKALASCSWEWQGAYSSWVCPEGDNLGDDFRDIFRYLREQVTSDCAKAVGNAYEKDLACIMAIGTAADTGGVVEIGGAG